MEPFLAEIRIFAGNFAPRSWAFCEGQLLSIAENSALFSLLGTMYGGDGRTTFALPDLRGRVPVSAGQGPGLPNYTQGQKLGAESNTLTQAQLPSHSHVGSGTFKPRANSGDGTQVSPREKYMAGSNADGSNEFIYTQSIKTSVSLGTQTFNVPIQNNGGGLPIDNQQPTIALNYIICISGTFPQRP